jgi:multiple sugar transport system permease protein
MYTWNDFLLPLIVINSSELYTVSLGLARFLGGQQGETPWHLLMAAAVMVTLPPLLLFFAAQRYIVQGVVSSGLKG